jgi:single-stranded-DNA-specific exonuclease
MGPLSMKPQSSWDTTHAVAPECHSEAGYRDLWSRIAARRGTIQPGRFWALPGVPIVASRILDAIRSMEPIVVHGDYDVDGISSALIITETILDLGGKVVDTSIARRREGYGLSRLAAERIASKTPGLIILCDLGTSSPDTVRDLQESGAHVVCVDHHRPQGADWPGLAIINPHMHESAAELDHACTATLAYMLCTRMLDQDNNAELASLAALGILADMADMRAADNRHICQLGLGKLRNTSRPGLLRIFQDAGLLHHDFNGDEISWYVTPPLNAAGRMDDASYALQALSQNEDAEDFAWRCVKLNTTRKQATEHGEYLAEDLGSTSSPFLCLWSERIHRGVIGLVANRLCRKYNRPTAVGHVDGDDVTISMRSPRGADLAMLCQDIPEFVGFGGHAQAGGATAKLSDMPTICRKLLDAADSLHLDAPTVTIDAHLCPSKIRGDTVQIMDSCLYPYGANWERPRFLANRIEVSSAVKINNGQRLVLKANGKPIPAVCFNRQDFRRGQMVNIVYYASPRRASQPAEPDIVICDAQAT